MQRQTHTTYNIPRIITAWNAKINYFTHSAHMHLIVDAAAFELQAALGNGSVVQT